MSTTTAIKHTAWCDPTKCDPRDGADAPIHYRSIGILDVPNQQVDVELFQIEGDPAGVLIDGNAEMDLAKIDELITLLTTARERLAQAQ